MDDITLYAALRGIKNAPDYLSARRLADAQLTPDTTIPTRFFRLALSAREAMYNPEDWGWAGKHAEVCERVHRWMDNGRRWAHWSEFHARRHGLADIGDRTENKSGCGDWLYSRRYSDRDRIIAEYWKKNTIIRWATKEFTIECTWKELFDYLAGYPAGIGTWFRTEVGFNATVSESVVRMQSYRNSKSKTAYLVACPYNTK